MVFDVYLRQGRETVHVYRYVGSRDLDEANRAFQAMMEDPEIARHLHAWDRVAYFPVGRDRGQTYPRTRVKSDERWF